ncbi:2-hydroxychromene-2-carboxylate isomerase [Tardiphaga sp.]|jgi:2-hydroxychromene-2-carboxylate isomerase|uniref:2-hydroxychromene-2-carboxylate isomerase n=1 Tax=Tardiphaga sp. TaxID=1926292 RepID=UPI0037DA03EE
MSQSIDYYFSLPSPWAYIGHKPFMDLVKTYDLKVNYKPVFLGELFAETGGLPLGKRHPVRQRYRFLELQRWREKRGLDFHLKPKNWPFDGRLADGVVLAALEAGLDPNPFLHLAFPAAWENEENVGDAAVLVRLADQAGLPGKQLVERSPSAEITAQYEQNQKDAQASDVFGSPAYVLNGEVFWGQDRIELLGDALKSKRAAFKQP